MYNWSNISLRVDTLMLEGPEFGRLAQHSAGLPDTAKMPPRERLPTS